jgi:hypothetical protein
MAAILDHRVGDDLQYLRILQSEAASVLDGHPLRELENIALITHRTWLRRHRRWQG